MRFTVLVLAMVLAFSSAAFARGACYMPDQTEAEQGLRIHTELMVIGLNCQHMIHDKGNLYVQYREFTRKNHNLIAGYEQTMIDYYRGQGAANPVGKLHDLRTMLANRIATESARMQPNVFCRTYGGRIAQANEMDTPKVRRWAQAVYSGFEPTRPSCNKTASRD